MKKNTLILIALISCINSYAQTFELEFPSPSTIPTYMIESKKQDYILSSWEQKKDTVSLLCSTISKTGKIKKRKVLEKSDTSAFNILKIMPNDSEYVCFGYRTFLKKDSTFFCILRLSHNFETIKNYGYSMPKTQKILSFDVCQYQKKYYFTWLMKDSLDYYVSFIGFCDNNGLGMNKTYIENKGIFGNVLSIKGKLLALSTFNIFELDDSLNVIKKSISFIPLLGTQGTFLKHSDSTYLIATAYNKTQAIPILNVAIAKYQYPFKSLKQEFNFGKKDTFNVIPITKTADFFDRDNIYLGGTAHFDWQYDHPSWFMLANLNENLKQNWQKYYGGDQSYYMRGVLATSDGGCLMYGTKYYYNTTKASAIYLLKVNAQGQLLATDGTPIPEENIKIFPNPARNVVNISANESESELTIYYFDSLGRSICSSVFQGFAQTNVADWQRGLYTYLIKNRDGKIAKSGKIVLE